MKYTDAERLKIIDLVAQKMPHILDGLIKD